MASRHSSPTPISLNDFLAWRPPKLKHIIGDGILPEGTAMILYGPFKSWKSMLLLDTTFKLAQGLPWYGHSTIPTSILMVQLEIVNALYHKRVTKYVLSHNSSPALPIHFVSHMNLKLDRDYGLNAMSAVLDVVKPQLLIIDPLYKILSGHANNSQDVQRLLDNIDMLRDRNPGMAVIIAAHTRKPVLDNLGLVVNMGSNELLGSGYFSYWADALVGITAENIDKNTSKVRLQFNDMRHTEVELDPVEVMIDRTSLSFNVV